MTRTVENVAEAAGALFVEKARTSVAARGRFVAVLSGGSTPLKMYAYLRDNHADEAFWTRRGSVLDDPKYNPNPTGNEKSVSEKDDSSPTRPITGEHHENVVMGDDRRA